MTIHLWLNQDEIDKQHDEVMLDVLVCEPLALWALRESDAFAKGAIISFGVGCVERFDGVAARNADWHCGCRRRELRL